MNFPLLALGLTLLAYGCFACATVWAAWRWSRVRPTLAPDWTPAVTVLKPVRGIDPEAYENFRSFCQQDYPADRMQLLFGALDPDDPALALAQRLQAEFPHLDIEVIAAPNDYVRGYNRKVCNLLAMQPHGKHDLLILCDSDMRVTPDYLRRIVAPFRAESEPNAPKARPKKPVGLVTCPYRGTHPLSLASWLEGIGIGADFLPGVLVSRATEGMSYAFGSTIALTRQTLDALGGLEAIKDEIADDYLLGNGVARLGYEVVLSDYIVSDVLGRERFQEMWARRLRWMRTMRACRPGGFAGSFVTYGVPLTLLFLICSGFQPIGWSVTFATLAVRLGSVALLALRFTQDKTVLRGLPLLPFSDLLSFALFVSAYFGAQVTWRGERFRLLPGGRLAQSANETRRISALSERPLD